MLTMLLKSILERLLLLKQIEHLESIRDNLRDQEEQMNQSDEQFTIDEQEEPSCSYYNLQ